METLITRPEMAQGWMLGSLEVFNALLVTVEQKPEGYCPVLDILVSLMSPALESRIEHGAG
jgi:hypothetical protein